MKADGRTLGHEASETIRQQKVNAISAVKATGAFWYDVYAGKFNAQAFIAKLKAFMRNRTRPVFLVLDGHPAHRADLIA